MQPLEDNQKDRFQGCFRPIAIGTSVILTLLSCLAILVLVPTRISKAKSVEFVQLSTDYTLPQSAKLMKAIKHNEWMPMDASYCLTFKLAPEDIESIKLSFPATAKMAQMPMKGCTKLRSQSNEELTVRRQRSGSKQGGKNLSFVHVNEESRLVTFELYSLW